MKKSLILVGTQWGDEGKGKIVDYFSSKYKAVCRFQGGHNAGHTIYKDEEKFVLHLIPSGIFYDHVRCFIGQGVILSLDSLLKEIHEIEEKGIDLHGKLRISRYCSLLLPIHAKIDQLREDNKNAIGTTRRLTPDKNDYIDVELNLPVKISKIAKNNNVKSFIYVSSGGANANSRNLYLQNKGKAEKEIINMSFEFTAIIQPSLLLGDRKENRKGEKIAKFIFKNLSFIFIGKLRPFKAIRATNVAKAIMYIKNNELKDLFFTSDKLENFSSIK